MCGFFVMILFGECFLNFMSFISLGNCQPLFLQLLLLFHFFFQDSNYTYVKPFIVFHMSHRLLSVFSILSEFLFEIFYQSPLVLQSFLL